MRIEETHRSQASQIYSV